MRSCDWQLGNFTVIALLQVRQWDVLLVCENGSIKILRVTS